MYKLNIILIVLSVFFLIPAYPVLKQEPVKKVIQVDFSKEISTGSPYVFGGTQPRWLTGKQWDALKKHGFTFMRSQADLTDLIPCQTIEEYKNNHDGCADPLNWDWTKGIYGEDFAKKAIERDMKVCLVIKNTLWNRWNGSGNHENTFPKDMDVWKDIIIKIINHYKGGITYLEIFNEVDRAPQFDYKGSPFDWKSGYQEAVYQAIQAVQASQYPETRVGGPAAARQGIEQVLWLLEDTRIRENLGCITFHDFDNPHYPSDAVPDYQRLMQRFKVNIPVVRTSYSPEFGREGGLPGTLTPAYIAPHLIGALKDGIEAAGLWEIQPCTYDDDPRYWFWYDTEKTVKTAFLWHLMSNTLGLGKGLCKIHESDGPYTQFLAATNSNDTKICVVNSIDSSEYLLKLNGLGDIKQMKVEFYSGDIDTFYQIPFQSKVIPVKKGRLEIKLSTPDLSVVGIQLIPIQQKR